MIITVINRNNSDVSGFSKQNRYLILYTREKNTATPSCHHEQQDRLLPPTRPHASRPRRNELKGRNEIGPRSDYGTSYQHTRTVSHYDPYEKYRVLTRGKSQLRLMTETIMT